MTSLVTFILFIDSRRSTDSDTDLDQRKEMINFESILTAFEVNVIFLSQLGQYKKSNHHDTKFGMSKTVKRSLCHEV